MLSPRPTLLATFAGLALAPAALGQLSNGGFETDGLFPFVFADWVNNVPEPNISRLDNTVDDALLIRTGQHSAKMFGQFIGGPNASLITQDIPATPGNLYELSVWGLHFSGDPITDANPGNMIEALGFSLSNIEFYDASNTLLEVTSFSPTTEDTPFDQWLETRYTATAPAGAATARIILGMFQLNNESIGAAYLDDADLVDVGPNMGLVNPGFDSYVQTTDGSFARDACCVPGWTRGGANSFVSGDFPSVGNSSLLMFGDFAAGPSDSTNVIFQDQPVAPGELVSLSASAAHLSGDPLIGANVAFMSLEFRDGSDQLLEITRRTMLGSNLAEFPTDAYLDYELSATAPASAATARVQYGFFQELDNPGAAFIDTTDLQFLGLNDGLVNPGFESFIPGGDFEPDPTLPLPGWGELGFNGGIAVDPNIGQTPDANAGEFAAFIFGQFPGDGSANDTVAFQDIPEPVSPGEQVTVDASVKQSAADPVGAGNALSISIEWFDGSASSLGSTGQAVLDSSSPQDIYFDVSVAGTAPSGTAAARINLVYTQVNEGTGAALIDDVSYSIAPAPACPGDINGDGATDVFDFGDLASNFGAGPGATREQGDLTGDGFVDVFDFGELAADFGCPSN